MKRINDQETERFYEAILKLRTTEECEAFFEDICTIRAFQYHYTRKKETVSLRVD